MLAETRARPAAISAGPSPAPPVPAGAGSALRSPRRAAALAVSSRSRRRATTRVGGSPACSAASWPQAAPISWPRFRRIETGIAGAPGSARRSASMTGIGLAVQGVCATGFIGMRLTCARSPRSSSASACASTSVSFTPPIIVYS